MARSKTPALLGFWDLAYREGDHLEHWEPPEVPADLIEAVEGGLVRPGNVALDVGCGSGCEAIYMASRGVAVVGVDACLGALDLAACRAREAGVAVAWLQGRAEEIPVADDAVDVVVDRGCFHVIPRRRRRRYACEVARVLRPGGAMLLRGARDDDDELGVVGCDGPELERLFGPQGLRCESISCLVIEARSGDLPALRVVLRRVRPRPPCGVLSLGGESS